MSSIIHLKRLEAIVAAVVAIVLARRLSVGAMGRQFPGSTAAKHSIKRFDRLLANDHVFNEIPLLYQALAHQILEPDQRITVLVDWTHVTGVFHALVAAVSFRGRALVLLADVRPEKQLGNVVVQRKFLERLKTVLPEGSRAVIVTDAGFHGDVFTAARKCGWDFIGRVRGTAHLSRNRDVLTKETLYACATTVPTDLGPCLLYKRRSVDVRVVIVRRRRSRRKSKPTRNKDEIAYRKSCRDPWLLVTSLTTAVSAQQVVNIYAQRMQIEETFRDAKSHRFGWCLGSIRSRSAKRLAVMLLLASIAMLAAVLIGFHAEQIGAHRRLQANTSSRRVLSLFTVGATLLARGLQLAVDALKGLLCEFRDALALGWLHSPLTVRGDP